ncbi:chorion class B protein PC10-like [Nymphalis io]|uniref:chorion class B protein PC10-like n=1 Tax=Inachis io TaxID=171585 RepID=UPI002169A90D|nr:chorion class B protein PC10-like [Nymphalis io]
MMKAVLLVCSQVFMIQSIAGQCTGPKLAAPYGAAWPATPLAAPCAYEAAAVPASNGGGLGVSSASAIPPSGVSVVSENAVEGALAVTGALPFLGTVALEGALPTAGAGAVNYACGSGVVTIVAEDIAPAGIVGPFGLGVGPLAVDALGYGSLGYGAGPYAHAGCGALI